MVDLEIPCPVCCKHIVISPEDFQKGGIFKCKACGNMIRLGAHKPVSKEKKNSKRKSP